MIWFNKKSNPILFVQAIS